MSYESACKILELEQEHTDNDVKKAYFKMALRYHPDKYKEDSGQKFREVKEAYDYLCSDTDKISIDENIDYKELIKMCIKYFSPETNWDNLFVDTSFHGLLKDCHSISLKIFDKLSKKKATQVYDFLRKFKSVLGIDEGLLNIFKKSLQERWYENIIVLNPTLKDLLNDNIFKLEVEGTGFYVPLWHHEVHFSLQDKELIVKCEPDISNNIWIDEHNNIYFITKICIGELYEKGFCEFKVGEKLIRVEGKSLTITKKKQVVLIKEKGILKINEEHTYDNSQRGDIIVEVFLV